MGTFDLEKLMRSNKDVEDGKDRDAFLSRVLGIINEEFVRFWAADSHSKYNDLGRPTIYESENEKKGKQIDFCFEIEENKKKKIYISEMKCEIEYQNYEFLTLSSKSKIEHNKNRDKPKKDQIEHHLNRQNPNAFKRFLYVTQNPTKYKDKYIIKVKEEIEPEDGKKKKFVQKEVTVHGGILVWGRVDNASKDEIMSKYNFADILSLEDIVNDLIKWENDDYFKFDKYFKFINKYSGWCDELFKGFKGNS